MGFQHLAQVHPGGNTDGVQYDVHRRAVGHVGHVFFRQDPGYHALVAVAAGHLVPDGDLPRLGDPDPDGLVHARRQVVAVLAGQDLNVDDFATFPVGHPQGGVLNVPGFLAEDGAQQLLLRGQFGLALGSDLADQDVSGTDVGADADDAEFVQVAQAGLTNVGDVPRDLFGTKFGLPGLHLMLFDMYGGEVVVAVQAFADDNGVFVVVPFPGHEGHQHILAQGQFPMVGGGAVGQYAADLHHVALGGYGALVEAGALVGAGELDGRVRMFLAVCIGHDDLAAGDRRHHAVDLGDDQLSTVPGHPAFDAGADHRRLRPQQRHGLTLHIGTHQGPVGVVMLQERYKRRRHAHDLHGRNVHVVDQVR